MSDIKESNTSKESIDTSKESIDAKESDILPIHPMLSFRLTADKKMKVSEMNFSIKSFKELKEELSNSKNKLDEGFEDKQFNYYWRSSDPFKEEKDIITKMSNNKHISNAWIKCYELIKYYDLIGDKDIVHFDNAAFPGSFVLSTHHYMKTMTKRNYKWYASSLINTDKSALEDRYGLWKKYPKNWLMHDKNNGDVLNEDNQLDFHKVLGGKVDLYTSDLGFDVSSDYNQQELLHCSANIGQILTGLLTLKKGGAFITKQYTYFESITISVMYIAASFFEEFYICKPYSSRKANSETYLVGKGFLGADLNHPYIKALFDKISGRSNLKPSIFQFKDYPKEYINQINKSLTIITRNTISKIDSDLERVEKSMKEKTMKHILQFREDEEPILESWYYYNPIRPINTEDRIA
jgi:hypothetical protein